DDAPPRSPRPTTARAPRDPGLSSWPNGRTSGQPICMDDVAMTSLAEGPAAVIFDFFGTLTPGIPAEVWLDHASQLAAVMGVDGPSVHEAMYESFPERATGALGDLPHTIQVIADRLGAELTSGQLDAACRVRRQVERQISILREDAVPTVVWLRA